MNSIIHFGLAQRSLPGDITLADISVMAQADGESGYNPDTHEIDVTVTHTKYRKWDVSLNMWIFSSFGGEGWEKIETTYTYKCCFEGGPGCNYALCDL